MTVNYGMVWKERWKDSGWVAEVKGFHPHYVFKNDFSNHPIGGKNKSCQKRWATYELNEGRRYLIKETDDETKYYAKVVDDELVFISEEEVSEYLISKGHKPHNKSFNRHVDIPPIHKKDDTLTSLSNTETNPNFESHNFTLDKSMEYMIRTLGKAYEIKKKSQDNFEGVVLAVWEYAKQFDIVEEFKEIIEAYKEQMTEPQVRNMFKTKLVTAEKNELGRESLLDKYDIPVSA